MRHRAQGSDAWTTRRILGVLGSVLIWVIVLIDAYYLWPTVLGGQTALVVVSGESMEPTYFHGDLVIARDIEPGIGDVIVYAPEGYGGAQIVHRITGGDAESGWIVQGDNNGFIDPFQPTEEEVVGVVLVHYPNLGRLTGLMLNPMVWASILILAIGLLIWFSDDDCDEDEEDNAAAEGTAPDSSFSPEADTEQSDPARGSPVRYGELTTTGAP